MFDKKTRLSIERGDSKEVPPQKEIGIPWSELLEELDGEAGLAKGFIDAVSSDPEAEEDVEDMKAVLKKIGVVRSGILGKMEEILERGKEALRKKEMVKNKEPLDGLRTLSHYIFKVSEELREKREARIETFVKQTGSEKYALPTWSFGDEDLLTEHPLFIRHIERVLDSVYPADVEKHLDTRAGRYSDDLVKDLNRNIESVCCNLVDNDHIPQAVDLWMKVYALNLNSNEPNPYYHRDNSRFFEELKHVLVRQFITIEPGVTVNDTLKEPSNRKLVVKGMESMFAKNPDFYAQCIIRMPDIFVKYQTLEDTQKTELSNEYIKALESFAAKGADNAARTVVKSLVCGIPGYVYLHVVRDAVASMDPALRKSLFQICLRDEKNPLGIIIRDELDFFEEEVKNLKDEERSRCFSLTVEKFDELIKFGREFFWWIQKLHLSFEEERVILDLLRKKGHQLDVAKFFKCFSRAAQVDIALHSDRDAMIALGQGIYPIDKNLPKAIAQRMIEVRLTKIVADHEGAFEDLGEEIKQRVENYRAIVQKIEQSPSRTVRRMKDALIEELSASADPERIYERVEAIFLRNHIPLAGKVFLAFETIYGERRIQDAYSPTLKEASPREARWLIYKDLINIHLDTGNPSLREYLEDLKRALPLIERVKAEGEADLTQEETDILDEFLRKVNILNEVSAYKAIYGKDKTAPAGEEGYAQKIVHWETALGVRQGQNLNERLEEMYLRPAGVRTIDQALARIDEAASRADRINRELAITSRGMIALQKDDLLKRVQSEHFLSYLQNGNVTKECLGYAAGADYTALDADTGKVLAQDLEKGNRGALEASPAANTNYGDIVLVFRPTPDRFFETHVGEPTQIRDQIRGRTPPYEVFQTPVADQDRHFGVRTGIPFTEVRCIIVSEPEKRRRGLLDLKMDIVANGYYVPLTDENGKIIFSPGEFDRLCNLYAGSEILPDRLPLLEKHDKGPYSQEIENIRRSLEGEAETIEKTQKEIHSRLVRVLEGLGIPLRTSGELAIGAEILHIGSTARRTSIPGQKIDFDVTIRLDENDLDRQKEIIAKLSEYLPGSYVQGANAQWRRADVDIFGNKLDIDISFTSKPEVEGIPSHAMAEQRLNALESINPQGADSVRANIVYAKQVLKKAGIYKKLDGGLGGLGVENWILQSGGSFGRARKEFLEAAIDEKGEIREFDDFTQRYSIPDPGINLIEDLDGGVATRRAYRHDNFVYFLQKEGTDGYKKMVGALKAI